MPLLHESLQRLNVMPHRKFESVEAFHEAFKDAEALLLDATERAHQRPVDEKQSELYSGKQKGHSKKHCDEHKGQSYSLFRIHDKRMQSRLRYAQKRVPRR